MGYGKHASKLSSGITLGSQISDSLDLGFVKFCHARPFTQGICTMSFSVNMIRLRCIPSKIIKMIMDMDSIVMATLHALRTRPLKGEKDESVNCKGMGFAIPLQLNHQITPCGCAGAQYSWLLLSPGPYFAMVRNIVSFKTRNWFPNFGHTVYIPHLADYTNCFYGLEEV